MADVNAIDTALRRSKRPRSIVAGPYGHPFHGLLVTIPIGAWVASIVFDIFGAVGDEPEPYRAGASLLIGIGIVGAILAAIVGLLDLSTLESGTRVRKIALTHMTLNFAAVAAFGASLAFRGSTGFDGESIAGVVLSAVGLVLLGGSGFLGGEMAYRYGVRVADEETQRKGFMR
jgi:uncharacterized membrane protein